MISGINIKAVGSVVLNYWRECIIALLLAVVIYQNNFETRLFFGAQTIPALEADLAIIKDNLNICKDGNAKLSAAIDENNIRIAAYKKLEEDMRGDIAKLKGELDAARAQTDSAVGVILNDPTPQTCEKAIKYLRDAGKELQW